MSLQFILGGAGTGKSYYMNHALVKEASAHPERRFLAIVPEQFTMETQKELADIHPGHSILNIDILSFERLAYRVFEELSCVPHAVLDDMGKSMVLRKACAGVEKELEVYRGHLDRAGFIDQLKSVMSEFGQYRIGEEELKRLTVSTENRPLLHRKLEDLQVLFGAFRASMEEGTITAEELLAALCRVLPRSKKVRDSVIALDGFTGFTPAQYEVLALLLRQGRRVMVAVTIDVDADPYGEKKSHDLFSLSRKTIGTLSRMAEELRAGRDEDVLMEKKRPQRFRESKELMFLSEQIFRYPCCVWKGAPEDIILSRAKTPLEETRTMAQRISVLVREKGLRYRDIAVVCGDMAGYRPILEQAMKEAGIPCFLDDKRSLLTNPLVEYMRAALEIVEKDFSYESVFRYLKCGFLPVEEDILYEMENYVLALGIRGHKRWSSPWEKTYRGGEHVNLEALNRAREAVAGPLLTLREAFKQKGASVRRMTEALFLWMEGQEADSVLRQMTEAFEEAGEYSLAKEYEQAYELLLGLFDRIVGLLGDEVLSVRTYNDVLDSGCREIRVGVIPAAIDRVLVGDVERSRLKDIKALFFIGVNDGNVPSPGKQGGLLSELDREELKAYVELTPTRRESSLMDKFYFYLTVTKPSRKLYISYAAADEAGGSKSPSSYIAFLCRVFPELETESEAERDFSHILTPPLAMKMLAEGMEEYRNGKASRTWAALYDCLYAEEENRHLLKRMADAAFYTYGGDRISRAVARVLYGEPLYGSVTRLETYAVCAYAQFLTYGLNLVKRKEFEFAALDMGNVFHRAIELCFKKAEERGISIASASNGERHELVEAAMEEAADSLGSDILKSSSRNHYLYDRMKKITEKTIWALGEQLAAGRFEPAAFELSFAPGENSAMRITLSEGGSMQLKGKIDRVDLFEDDEKVYVKIVDYKSGGTDFDLNAVYHGLQLQLVVYLDAVIRREQERHPGKEIVPAGMFYYQIQDPVLERESAGASPEAAVLEALRPKGLFNGEEEVVSLLQQEGGENGASKWIPAVMKDGSLVKGKSAAVSKEQLFHLRNFVSGRMKEFGTAIAGGDVSAAPYKRRDRTGCDYCDFQSVCGFDKKTAGYDYKRLAERKPEEIWKEMAEKDESGGKGR
ncbi:PD-(D/E)XK nuclease family protein [Qiania dongpingensis]|uniref:Exodeoxyribonuclease V subunit gamma n=1 Tax=Qiania dongpingensis TaxID=2763669 RepID=A0A7G9G323_9FIRM|nr:PD-(D/E)XK nuclease family protein [Qiania dongpingensis]QNM05205.1 exodeoxyribonuclease V subunit gamma [Qiania dongpingensis]